MEQSTSTQSRGMLTALPLLQHSSSTALSLLASAATFIADTQPGCWALPCFATLQCHVCLLRRQCPPPPPGRTMHASTHAQLPASKRWLRPRAWLVAPLSCHSSTGARSINAVPFYCSATSQSKLVACYMHHSRQATPSNLHRGKNTTLRLP